MPSLQEVIMQVEFSSKELSIKQVLFKLKYYILGFVAILFGLSFLMARLHPKRISYAKEYNYLYSMAESLAKGREVSLEKLDDKLQSFAALRPNFDSFFVKNYLEMEEFEKVTKVMEEVSLRLPTNAGFSEKFAKVSILLEKGELENAYATSVELKKDADLFKEFPLFYAYNLYRIYVMEQCLSYDDKAASTKNELIAFIKEQQQQGFDSIILEKMMKEIDQ